MPPVFAHGRLRLYLLKLLDEAPRHGYEIIRLLEERFQGLYAPSAGTVYPRLAKLEAEGLIAHTTEGGRKVYAITAAGRAELAGRQGELAELELEIRESVAALAADIREDVRGAAGDLRRQVREAARQSRAATDSPSFDSAKEDFRRAKEQWKEQARRAKEESRRARQDAQQARHQAREAQQWAHEEVRRATRHVQEQVEEHLRRGDWPTGVAEGVSALAKEFGAFAARTTGGAGPAGATDTAGPKGTAGTTGTTGTRRPEPPAGPAPEWAEPGNTPSADPARDLDRLLDRFRDDIRDAARDHGVTQTQLDESRHHLATAAARITTLLRPGG
ncbi:helix-turn-helix transcriptional regulator [Streptomyces roseifaciens]